MRVAPQVTLSPEERSWISRRARASGEIGRRARIVGLAAMGRSDSEIANAVGVNRQTSARWRRRFLEGRLAGLDAIEPVPRLGRIPEETVQAIVRATVTRHRGDRFAASTRRLAEEFGVSHMTVRRVWESYGVRPTPFEVFPPRYDAVAPAAPRDLVGLYLHSSSAALAWTLGSGPPAPGPSDITRVALAFRALSTPKEAEQPTDAELRQFLGRLDRRLDPGLSVRIAVTGLGSGAATAIQRWRVRHPRFELDLLPDFAQWKERAERELRAFERGSDRLTGGFARAEISRSLSRYITTYRTDGPPFRWIAGRREIAAGRAAPRLRYDLSVTGHPGFKSRPEVGPVVAAEDKERERRASARNVLRQYLRVRAGERVTIECWTSTLGDANAFVLETLRLGARPLLLYQDEETYWAATTEVPAASLARLGEHRRAALERTDVFVSFLGPSDRERFHALPFKVRFRLGEYEDALYDAAAKAGARAVQMAIGRVSDASARMYGVDAGRWRAELLAATLVDPRVLKRRARLVSDRLARGSELRVRHANGTDLTLRLLGRVPNRSDGTVARTPSRGNWSLVTLPAGVVSVSVDETSAEGVFESNIATAVGLAYGVGEFRVGRWTFEGGRLRRFRYREGQELFSEGYSHAGEGRDRPGAISIGLNENIESSPLLEDQALGTVTFQIGRNDYLGGRTRLPWWAWLNLRGADLTVDGLPLLKSGALAAGGGRRRDR